MMIKKLSVYFAASLITFSLVAADSGSRLSFPLAGFSIAPLDAAPGSAPTQTALMMFMPPNGNFAANVNVIIQSSSGTLEDYMAQTLKQFQDHNVKVISQKNLGKSAALYEYSAPMQGSTLHCYSRAEKSGDHIYLVTATIPDDQWAKQGTQLKACVESFRCEPR